MTIDPGKLPREVHLVPVLYGKIDELKDEIRRICAIKGEFDIHYVNASGIICELWEPVMMHQLPTNHLIIACGAPMTEPLQAAAAQRYPPIPPEREDPIVSYDPTEIRNRCMSCNARSWRTVFVPCGHLCLCRTCAATKRPTMCMYCKAHIREVVVINYTTH
jgi:hypothetical protein